MGTFGKQSAPIISSTAYQQLELSVWDSKNVEKLSESFSLLVDHSDLIIYKLLKMLRSFLRKRFLMFIYLQYLTN